MTQRTNTHHIYSKCPTEEESKNLQIVAQYFTEYWGKANSNIVDDLCADDFTMNYPMHGIRHGKSSTKNMLTDLKRQGIPRYFIPRLPASTQELHSRTFQ
ncbi:hypothetical protein TrVFT333_006764 [Trichoderma virens FT-333]|nr:hypothetical protein TrVFT333_006764 [Trichoderma virens FT-333]